MGAVAAVADVLVATGVVVAVIGVVVAVEVAAAASCDWNSPFIF